MEINKRAFRSVFFGVAGCIFLYWLLHETERLTAILNTVKTIFSPFIVGAAAAFILNVPMRAIERLLKGIANPKARRTLAILTTLIAVALVLAAVFYLLIPQVIQTIESLIASLPKFISRVQTMVSEFLTNNPEILQWLKDNTEFENFDLSGVLKDALTVLGNSLTTIMTTAITTIGSLSTGIFNGVLSFVFAMYCLTRKEILARQGRRILYAFFPESICDEIIRILRMTNLAFSRFISGQCLEALILGSMFAVSMLILQMPFIPLVSVIISVTALVPIVGAFVGCILGAFFIMVVNPVQAFWFVIMFLALQQIEGNLIYPRVVGTSIGLPGMWVLVAVAVGGDLMGVGGMLLMIPLASVMYALLREITDRRLAFKGVPREKLQDQPLEFSSKLKQKRQNVKEKRKIKAESKKQSNGQEKE